MSDYKVGHELNIILRSFNGEARISSCNILELLKNGDAGSSFYVGSAGVLGSKASALFYTATLGVAMMSFEYSKSLGVVNGAAQLAELTTPKYKLAQRRI